MGLGTSGTVEDATAGSNAAPEPRYIGTPIGGERKARRVRSPLQELDGMTDETDKEDARATAVEASEDFVRQPEFESPPQSPRPQGDNAPLAQSAPALNEPPGIHQHVRGVPTGENNGAVTMEALESLFDRKLGTVRNEIAALKAHAVSRQDLSTSLAPITNDVNALKGDVKQIEVGLEAAKATAKEAKASVEALRIEFEQRLHMGPSSSSLPTTPQLSARQATILFGGFESDFDTACMLINSDLDKINAQWFQKELSRM